MNDGNDQATKVVPMGLRPPKFCIETTEIGYFPQAASKEFLLHMLKVVIEKSGGSLAADLEAVQQSMLKASNGEERAEFRLWMPVQLDAAGGPIWVGSSEAAIVPQRTAGLEVVHHGPAPAAYPEDGPLVMGPDGAPMPVQ